MNEYDLLLQWFSTRPCGEAGTALLQEACLALHQRATARQEVAQESRWLYRFRDTLYRCGHIEHIRRSTWAVMPPTVVWLGGQGNRQEGEAHVYGARSPSLQAQLQQAWGSQFFVISQHHGPAVWKWVGTRAQSEDFAMSFRSTVSEERGASLLHALPSLAEALHYFPAGPLPAGHGWEFWHVTPSATRGVWWNWIPRPQALVQGVYRTTRHPRVWAYVAPKPQHAMLCAYRLDPAQHPDHLCIAQWQELARSGCLSLRYDASEHTLHIPHVGVELPLLVDRALRLASGYCPRVVSDTRGHALVFADIKRRRARQVARVLALPLEITHG